MCSAASLRGCGASRTPAPIKSEFRRKRGGRPSSLGICDTQYSHSYAELAGGWPMELPRSTGLRRDWPERSRPSIQVARGSHVTRAHRSHATRTHHGVPLAPFEIREVCCNQLLCSRRPFSGGQQDDGRESNARQTAFSVPASPTQLMRCVLQRMNNPGLADSYVGDPSSERTFCWVSASRRYPSCRRMAAGSALLGMVSFVLRMLPRWL
jgi:hypothetical protein